MSGGCGTKEVRSIPVVCKSFGIRILFRQKMSCLLYLDSGNAILGNLLYRLVPPPLLSSIHPLLGCLSATLSVQPLLGSPLVRMSQCNLICHSLHLLLGCLSAILPPSLCLLLGYLSATLSPTHSPPPPLLPHLLTPPLVTKPKCHPLPHSLHPLLGYFSAIYPIHSVPCYNT